MAVTISMASHNPPTCPLVSGRLLRYQLHSRRVDPGHWQGTLSVQAVDVHTGCARKSVSPLKCSGVS